jgi:hypothetical protein
MRPTNIDPPDFSRAVRIWRNWQRQHPVNRLDHWLWEQQKDRYRKWWFSLSRYEQDRLKAIREDTGQYIVSHFKGPKYQRGMLSGLSVKRSVTSGPSATLELNSANNTATNVDISPPTALDAGFGLFRAGTHFRTNSAGTNQINSGTDWITPRDSAVGDDYEVKWNLTIGSAARINDESYTEDTWVTLNVSTGRGRYVGKSTSAFSVIDQFEIDIGDQGTSSSDVNQNYSVEAGDVL